MTGNLDFATGVVVLFMGAVLATLHVLTSPKSCHWQTLPGYLRAPFWPVAGLCVWRGVDLLMLSRHPEIPRYGHANGIAFLTAFGLAVILAGFLTHVLARTYPKRLWDRLNWMDRKMREAKAHPEAPLPIPALLTKAEVKQALETEGWAIINASSFVGDETAGHLDDAGEPRATA